MRRTLHRSIALLAAVIASGALAACAPAAVEDAGPSASAPSASAEPTATTTAPPAPPTVAAPGGGERETFATQNGTMRIRIPVDWTVEERGGLVINHDGRQQWDNSVRFTAPSGERLGYYDGYMSDAGAASTEHGIIDERRIADGVVAMAWRERYADGPFHAFVNLQTGEGEPASEALVRAGEVRRAHSLSLSTDGVGFDAEPHATREAAEAAPSTPTVRRALDIMSTLELTGVDQYAMPDDVAVEEAGTTYLPYETRNGSSTFLVPAGWTIDDRSAASSDGSTWRNDVTLTDAGTGFEVVYRDFAPQQVQEWPGIDWRLGELRPTADGWDAGSWADLTGDFGAVPTMGVSLTDAGDAERPQGVACTDSLCRTFGGEALGSIVGAADADAWFGSRLEERALTTIASLEALHGDPTRMGERR